MPRAADVICISSIDWDFIWQGHQEIMSRLAADARSPARAPADPELVARHEGVPRRAAEPVRLLAARAAVAVPASVPLVQPVRADARDPPVDAGDRFFATHCLDVPADAARAGSHRGARPAGDDL